MESRGTKSKAETDLRQQLQANAEAAEFARRQLAELSAGSSRIERDAVIVVHKSRREAGTVRLGYLVGSANWSPQYRLRGAADDAPGPARIPRRRGPADRRGLAGRPRHALHRPAVARRRAARAAPAQDGRRRRRGLRPGRGTRRPVAAGSPPSWGSRSTCRSRTDTPLEDVIKYIRKSTNGPGLPRRHPDLRRPRRPPGGREDDGLPRDDRPPRHPAADVPQPAPRAARPDLSGQGRPADDHLDGLGGSRVRSGEP